MGVSYTYIFQFCVILQCMTLWRSGMQNPACTLHFTDEFDKFQYFQDGDLIIGGVFTVREKEEDLYLLEGKTYSPSFMYYKNLLAFLYAIDNINQDSDILPNITLGFHVFDSWLEPRKAVQSVLQILSGPNGTFPNYSYKGQGKLAGVIGDQYSTTTIPIAQILGLYRYTQVSNGATDYSLSDRLLYPHVFRTVQNDYVYYLAIAKLVKHFGWNWVGILFSDNDTGENEAQILKRNLASQEICVAFEKRMTMDTMDQWTDTLSKVHCKVLILCGSFTSNARRYLNRYSQFNRNNMIILPTGWTSGDLKTAYFRTNVKTSLSLQLNDPQILNDDSPFDDNLLSRHSEIEQLMDELIINFYNITSTQNGKNIYFQKITIFSQNFIRLLFPKIKASMLCEESLRVYIAVEAMAEAIHFFNKFNHSFNINRFKQLHKYVKQIKNPYKTAERMTLFDENGEFPFHYKIVNQMNSYRQLKTSNTVVGLYTPWAKEEDQLHIDPNKITWNEGNNTKMESRCVDSCLPGYRKKPGASFHSCCYDCASCSEGQISNMTDSENCMNCPEEEWPNEKKDRCIPKHLEFLSYTDGISKVFLSISAVFCIVTVLIKGIFISYLNTPIVKANNRNLSFVLLVSILLSFLCVFLFLGQPLDITCILRVMTFGVIFSIAVSSLLAKTIMVYIAFKATKPGSYWRKWLGSKLANSIVSVCSSIQVIICITWLSSSRPFKEMDTHSYQDKVIIQCNEGSVIGFYSVLGYMGFLAAVSFVMAFIVRTLPDSFNEAKYITFSMLVFCNVWISMIPAYLSAKGKYMVAVEIFAILASSAGLLICIFFPKCFIILFKPELNTQSCLLDRKNRHEYCNYS
ncbi:vomeronasal type-2 receptor 26-like [Aquarana catesbeiana]|uniref:vomeronasal type-2 receptor 26-like n=1 Tax=Aquarana catesbeiana TaxID=8400 RepID=UPI003CCA0058